ncbi:hypothetical protein EC545_07045 [Helicobacter pylori]|uniref:hypothetical protein n=1 Tax=Helicobacter pylori TaxID=210 RepID=UPI000FDEAE4D|nr:hypothetical protein [Helicobacter pylori]RVZ36550.1 hypothetical protein EC545_07045 [Helicobacter pylori]RVZ75321.1 hypothetical protein EC593_07530 [Helicobacter pylori]
MWNERFLKVIPALVFLFCMLEICELVLIINDLNKTEKLEVEIKNDLKMLQDDIIVFNKYFQHNKINIK